MPAAGPAGGPGAAAESRPGPPRLKLLVRSWCHLCHDMALALGPLLEGSGVAVLEVDVDADPALEARYGWDVPVLLAGEEVLCRHRIDPPAVTAWLQKTAKLSSF